MSYEKFKEKLKRDNCLEKIDRLGSFDFYTTVITLDAVDQAKYDEIDKVFPKANGVPINSGALSPQQYQLLAEFWPLLIHEYTHFIDATSTLWGLSHLELMIRAYGCSQTFGGREADYHYAKKFHDHVTSLRLPTYYTTVEKNVAADQPWQLHHTLGMAYDFHGQLSNRPILFGSFHNKKGERITRSPLSTVSLLESSAMSQEIGMHSALLSQSEEDFKIVERTEFSRQIIKTLYHPELTEYSVCVHIVANYLQVKDPVVAFRFCAVLTRIALNYPDSAFQRLLDKNDLADILRIPNSDNYVPRLKRAIELRDRGALFYLLTKALPAGSASTPGFSIARATEHALARLHTPKEDFVKESAAEADRIYQRAKGSKIPTAAALLEAGFSNYQAIDIFTPPLPFHELDLPPAWLKGNTQISPFEAKSRHLKSFKVDDFFWQLAEGEDWVLNFSKACMG